MSGLVRDVLRPLALALAACVIAGATTARAADPEMSFRSLRLGDPNHCGRDCPEVIAASGQITQATPERFLDFVERHAGGDTHAVLFIDSPGGRVLASMEFGTLLRKLGAAAVVARLDPDGHGGTVLMNARCLSACVYALMGARKRVIPTTSLVGIHRMFAWRAGPDGDGTPTRTRRFDDGDMRAALMDYSSQMGVSPGLVDAAEQVPSDKIRILTRADIRRWHLGVPKL